MSRKLPLKSGYLRDGQKLSMAIRISQLEEKLLVGDTARCLLRYELANLINLARNPVRDIKTSDQLLEQVELVLQSTDDDVFEMFYESKGLLTLGLNFRAFLSVPSVSGVDDTDKYARVQQAEAMIVNWINERLELNDR